MTGYFRATRVFVVGGDDLVRHMFESRRLHSDCYLTVDKFEDADLIVFTGGHDVNPELYGEEPHPQTNFSNIRDKVDIKFYELAVQAGLPMAGICRGGQFLNVMNGGKMWQHVNNHTQTHYLRDTLTNREILVTSTHHQMMIPKVCEKDDDDRPVIVAKAGMSTTKESDTSVVQMPDKHEDDYEVLYYPRTRSLCFQPHPEYRVVTCNAYFFELLKRHNLQKKERF